MLKFFACYIWLILGFLTAFMILFSSEKIFKYFPVPLITMLVWMTGEMDSGILHPKTKNIRLKKHRLKEDPEHPEYNGISHNSEDNLQFEGNIIHSHTILFESFNCTSGTAHLFFAAYVLLFSIVIMNLLIGLAVSDIGSLMKSARRESIISQINMINEMSDRRSTILYRYCLPQCVKKLFER